MRLRKFINNEEGSALVLVAAAMVALVGFAALVVDAGELYINRAELAKAIDSSVLAGVQHLPENPNLAVATAEQYAQLNGLQEGEYEFATDDSGRAITAVGNREVLFHFAPILGFDSSEVYASAAARIAPLSSTSNIVPFGVLEDEYEFGEIITLKEAAGSNTYSGWFGALRLGGNGASVYRSNIEYGYDGTISIGDIIPIESGNMSGPTSQGVAYRIDECDHYPRCTIDSYVEGCSRIMVVPIVNIEEINNGGHPESVRVVGFAAFLVKDYVGHGNDNEVEGAFIRYVIPGDTETGAGDFGVYSAYLYE